MKKEGVFSVLSIVLLIFLISSVLAEEEEFFNKKDVKLSFTLENNMEVIPTKGDYDVQDVNILVSYVPLLDYRQTVSSLVTTPKASRQGDNLLFRWDELDTDHFSYKIEAEVVTKDSLKMIKDTPKFPISNLDAEYKQFIVETDSVDFKNEKIRALAQSIASGENDIYVVTHKFATWVNDNIEYDLNTQTSEASKKASWVLENKRGVCDELTNLFLALCRSVGIPARFVSGLAYTTDERFTEKWSPHGWAEVYFPDYGWVAFDVTYGEFGYISPGHLKLKVSDDANKSSTKYEWKSYGANIKAGTPSMDVEVLSVGDEIEPYLDISAKMAYDEIGFNSYNVLEVTLKNPYDFYVPANLMLSKTQEINLFDNYRSYVLLKPGDEHTFYYPLKLDGDFDEQYIYTFKISVNTLRGAYFEATFKSNSEAQVYSLQEARDFIDSREEEEEKTYSKSITLDCSTDKDNYFISEDVKISCLLKNTGNVPLELLNVCLDDECNKINVGISEQKEFGFERAIDSLDTDKFTVTAKNTQVSKQALMTFSVFERPVIKLKDIKVPSEVRFDEAFAIEFKVARENDAPVNKAKVYLESDLINKEWVLEKKTEEQSFILNVDKNILTKTESDYVLRIEYEDGLGRRYSDQEEFHIHVKDVDLKTGALMFLIGFGNFFVNNPITAGAMMLATIISFGFVMGFLFSNKKK